VTDLSLPPFGRLAWVDVILVVWFAATVVSVAFVVFDAIRNNPEMKVMRWGWVLVTLYLGLHCHIPHHTTNNNVEEQGGGGLMMIIEVSP